MLIVKEELVFKDKFMLIVKEELVFKDKFMQFIWIYTPYAALYQPLWRKNKCKNEL
jgi:hypothetical protein